ncbi:MAG: hypothetical protein FIB01_03375 [Gemmatimonadetes bacterium]|nr:hypothetical protein [Gemmatimonadota bacterium]
MRAPGGPLRPRATWPALCAAALALSCAPAAPAPAPAPPRPPEPPPAAAPAPAPAPVFAARVPLARATPAEVGMDAAALDSVDALIDRALADGAAPGAALAVGRHGRLVRLRGYGRLAPDGAEVSDSSIYDLASLTKVIGTTSALMLLVDRGQLDLDAPVLRYIPEWQGDAVKNAVTVRNLMLHNAGLAAFAPLYRTLRGRAEFRRALGALPLQYPPGTQSIYSDFGFMLLGLIVEQVSGRPLDVFLQQELFGPLGLNDTGYIPLPTAAELALPGASVSAGGRWPLARIAPTEVDTSFRFGRVHGWVHDENAFALGGVSGHAGLFSSARDLAVIAQLLLDGGSYAGRSYISPATVAQFTARQAENSSRALGWDTPSRNSSAGDYFGARSFGHTGFTGTSVWADPERDVFVVLLTNRVYSGRDNQRVTPLRRAVADAVQQAIRDQPVTVRATGR